MKILKLKVAICYKSHYLHKKYTTEIDKLFNLINYKFRYKGNLLFNISISKITINDINISIAPKHCNLLKEIGDILHHLGSKELECMNNLKWKVANL